MFAILTHKVVVLSGSGFVPVPPSSLGGPLVNNRSFRAVIFGLRSGIFLRRIKPLSCFARYQASFKYRMLNTVPSTNKSRFARLYIKGILSLA